MAPSHRLLVTSLEFLISSYLSSFRLSQWKPFLECLTKKFIILFKALNYNFPIFEQILKANIKNNFFPFNQDFCISREEWEKRRLIRWKRNLLAAMSNEKYWILSKPGLVFFGFMPFNVVHLMRLHQWLVALLVPDDSLLPFAVAKKLFWWAIRVIFHPG